MSAPFSGHNLRRSTVAMACLSLVLVLPACAARTAAPAAKARPTEQELSVVARTADDVGSIPRFPTGVIDLRDALAAALLGNPDLAAFSWEVRAREARTLQAGRFPNPELATEFEDFGGSGDRSGWQSAQSTLSLSQLIELGGKRA